ncbi:uncharacterized protein LOC115365396 isoform X2 [Myripristis murdjan]|uniref:uncharacterized protein LOC115365396 isoform X2 n=1 Tax=Myripristis murdjan TaxID=586833 RepID=UPI0011762FA4|nr:uncharacterized protein LOC115365396 isoform X2 [Myripristis murdjan]
MESSQETNLPNRSSSPVVWAMAVSKKVFCMIVLMHLMSPPESAPTAASGNAVGNRSSPTVFACTNKGCKVDLVWCQDDKVFDNGDIPDCKSHHSWQSRSVCECDGRVMVVLDGTYSCEFEGPDGTIDGEYYTAPASCFPPEGRRQNQSDNSPKEMQGGESNSTDSAGAGNDQENPPNTGAIVGGVVVDCLVCCTCLFYRLLLLFHFIVKHSELFENNKSATLSAHAMLGFWKIKTFLFY